MSGYVFCIAKVAQNEFPIPFPLTSCSVDTLVSENPGHDFPRLLRYQHLSDGRLEVPVSDGAEGGYTLVFARADTETRLRPSIEGRRKLLNQFTTIL